MGLHTQTEGLSNSYNIELPASVCTLHKEVKDFLVFHEDVCLCKLLCMRLACCVRHCIACRQMN